MVKKEVNAVFVIVSSRSPHARVIYPAILAIRRRSGKYLGRRGNTLCSAGILIISRSYDSGHGAGDADGESSDRYAPASIVCALSPSSYTIDFCD